MEQHELLYEGKAKPVCRTLDPELLIQHFEHEFGAAA